MSGNYLGVVRQLSGVFQTVVRQSSGSHQEVIRQSSGSRQAVFKQSSGRRQAVVRFRVKANHKTSEPVKLLQSQRKFQKFRVNLDNIGLNISINLLYLCHLFPIFLD